MKRLEMVKEIVGIKSEGSEAQIFHNLVVPFGTSGMVQVDSDAMNNIIVPLYHMRCHLAEVRIVHEGQFVSRIF